MIRKIELAESPELSVTIGGEPKPWRLYNNSLEFFFENSSFKDDETLVEEEYTRCKWGDQYIKDTRVSVKKVNEKLKFEFGPRPVARFNAVSLSMLEKILPRDSWYALRKKRGKIDTFLVGKTIENKDKVGLITQLCVDNMLNVVPVFLNTNLTSVPEARDHYGKGLWKRICNTPKTKNNLVFRNFHGVSNESIRYLLCSKYSLLMMKSLNAKCETTVRLCNDIVRGKNSGIDYWREIKSIGHVVYDTKSMFLTLGETFNPDWSLRRIKEAHSYASKEINKREYSSVSVLEPHCITIDGFTFTRLVSELEVADEGSEMKHCVASYAKDVSRGEYMVYKVESPTERATLGLRRWPPKLLQINQIYSYCNSSVSDEMESASEKLLKEIT